MARGLRALLMEFFPSNNQTSLLSFNYPFKINAERQHEVKKQKEAVLQRNRNNNCYGMNSEHICFIKFVTRTAEVSLKVKKSFCLTLLKSSQGVRLIPQAEKIWSPSHPCLSGIRIKSTQKLL